MNYEPFQQSWWQRARRLGRWPFPPKPMAVQMTDSVTGTVYLLSHTGEAPDLTLELSTDLYARPDVHTFGPYEGPFLYRDARSTVRLYVEDGVLAGTVLSGGGGQRVFTRSGNSRDVLEITVDADWTDGDDFTYTYTEL